MTSPRPGTTTHLTVADKAGTSPPTRSRSSRPGALACRARLRVPLEQRAHRFQLRLPHAPEPRRRRQTPAKLDGTDDRPRSGKPFFSAGSPGGSMIITPSADPRRPDRFEPTCPGDRRRAGKPAEHSRGRRRGRVRDRAGRRGAPRPRAHLRHARRDRRRQRRRVPRRRWSASGCGTRAARRRQRARRHSALNRQGLAAAQRPRRSLVRRAGAEAARVVVFNSRGTGLLIDRPI